MAHQVWHKGLSYWITIDPTRHTITNEQIFIAYVKQSETAPEGLFYGHAVRDGNNEIITFLTELSALTNARAIIESY